MTEYVRTIEDELDWSLLEQLHRVTLQISTFCFRTKQICVTVDIAVVGILAKLTDQRVDRSMFVAGLLIPLAFWLLDGIAYYYQVKIRGVMDGLRSQLRARNKPPLIEGAEGAPQPVKVIGEKRVSARAGRRLAGAFFNHSMWLYLIMVVADVCLWIYFGALA